MANGYVFLNLTNRSGRTRDGKSTDRNVRMCAQLNRHSPLPRPGCSLWVKQEGQGKIKSKSFRLNDPGNCRFVPTPSDTSSPAFETEIGGTLRDQSEFVSATEMVKCLYFKYR